jgi:hypothetical protein
VTPHLESTSLDGFLLIWTQEPGGSAGCTIDMRFNFLSTDFSLAKGVKGLSSRLSAKTEQVSVKSPPGCISETCYCEVRLFERYGAERRRSCDKVNLAKKITRIQRAITELRSGELSKSDAWSVAPDRRVDRRLSKRIALREPTEQELHLDLKMMQAMLNSVYSVSLLGLRGQERDAPDLHPLAPTHPPQSRCQTIKSVCSELGPPVSKTFSNLLDQHVRIRGPRSNTSSWSIGACSVQPCRAPLPERPLQASMCIQSHSLAGVLLMITRSCLLLHPIPAA